MITKQGELVSLGDALQLPLEALRAGCDVEIRTTDRGYLFFCGTQGSALAAAEDQSDTGGAAMPCSYLESVL